MFSSFQRAPEVDQGASRSVDGLVTVLESIAESLMAIRKDWNIREPLEARLLELEQSRTLWEAGMEAELVRAESRFSAARGAEERARGLAKGKAKSASSSGDGPDDVTEELIEAIRRNAEASAGEQLPLVPEVVAVSGKAAARSYKFGLG